jgi:hypothetical protein
MEMIPAARAAVVALDVEHIELADQIAEYDRAVDPTLARLRNRTPTKALAT